MRNGIPSILTVVIAAIFIAGCQQPQQTADAPNEKQARLLAAQSADLQKQLAARQAEIEALRQKHSQDLRQRDEELARCKARIEALQKEIDKGIAERVSGVTAAVMEENARLRQEVERLKAELQKPPEQ
jgi:predicted transcriptional regulator